MFSWVGRKHIKHINDEDNDSSLPDPLLRCKDLEKHFYGEFSMGVVQANVVIEDHCQVETGQDATFVGVYDGHGGPEASRFIRDHLFLHLMRIAKESGTISEDSLRNAFSAAEDGFLTLVRRTYGIKPLMISIGSCCLVGVIWKATLYIANLGDSRAVKGHLCRSNKIVAEQLTRDHNASMEEVRQELRSLHPEDTHILVKKNGVWRIKGIIQVRNIFPLPKSFTPVSFVRWVHWHYVSRSIAIGDAYLKRPEFSLDPSFPQFHLPEPIRQPVLRADPSVFSQTLRPHDKFLIFASDGLWEHLTNQEAVDIVYNNPREGIARRLVKSALHESARKRKMRYEELKKHEKGVRRFYHDDITVVVIFIDSELLEQNKHVPEMSVRGGIDTIGPSRFNILQLPNTNSKSAG